MTATAYTGDCVPTPRASKPKHSLSVPAHTLVIDTTPNGFVCKLAGVPVAWIVCGYHHGQSDGKPKVCHFVDVAYHRQTTRGINLETRDFAILLDAIAFVQSVFKSTVQEGGAQ